MAEVSTGQSEVSTDQFGSVLLVTINRPQARNAVNAAVSTGVGDALDRAQHDPEIRVVVLTGSGDKSFCAGADLKAISRGEQVYHTGHPEWGFGGYVRHFVDKPTIAAVNGTALGGGTELVLASDLAVADERATFGLPEVQRGLLAAAGGAFRIVEQLPRKKALELLYTGDPISAAQAAEWGLINKVVPDGSAVQCALELAERISSNAPLSVQASKRVAYAVGDGKVDGAVGGTVDGTVDGDRAAWARITREFTEIRKSEDATEGPLAFAQKRPPVFKAR